MDIKATNEKHTLTWLKSQDSAGKLNKNISIQRREVWDAEKSNLIVSLLLAIPLESLLLEESDHKSYNVLDGKQRTLTLCAYLEDEFALSPKIRVKEIDGKSLAGLKFSMLPKELQSKITEYELSISVLRSLTPEERAMVFFMRNQAAPLSKMDLSLVVLGGEEAMDTFNRLCDHSFMQEKIKLTAPARRKHDDLNIMLQYMILRSRPGIGFSDAEIMSFCDDIKNDEADVPADEITALFDYLDEAISEKRAYLKKVHIPIVLYVAQLAKEKDISPEEFGLRLDAFFENLPDDGEYMAVCRSGSTKRTNVQTRMQIMSEMLDGVAPKKKEASTTLSAKTRKKK